MQSSQTIIPFARPDRKRHNDAYNPQGRYWGSKHGIRDGRVVKLKPKRQSYPVLFLDDHSKPIKLVRRSA